MLCTFTAGISDNFQVCSGRADAVLSEQLEFYALGIRVQLIEQPESEGFGAEAA
jgi:hypothetical protein